MSNKCSWIGCPEKNPFICAKLRTYHDDGSFHRETEFCSLEHLACWAIDRARREDLSERKTKANPKYLEMVEQRILDIMDDRSLDHVKKGGK